ncbi:5-formyltetrahydrofolate cyclo-ligase [Clostridiales bacterium oral taxon 876 str. F0540]|nr:5-formyltetrahydrofolate cyclo-ligase [Clostridiales bacterium oral taxon 876 str. F0540]
MNKVEIRKSIKSLRDSMNKNEKKLKDDEIFNKVITSRSYINAKTIFIYVSMGSEADTHRIINKALEDNKLICVPKVINRKEGMKAIKIKSLSELVPGNFGVLEPVSFESQINPAEIDLLIMPGLAFDKFGGRLGYGAGYYDRFLQFVKKEARKLALAYSFQILDKVPMEDYDVFIDEIITEQ